MRVATRQRWLAGVLCLVIIASGTPRVVSFAAAQRSALQWDQVAQAAASQQATEARLGAPPDAHERRLHSVIPSGANPVYPPNHTFDAATQLVGTPPANNDFEDTSSASVGAHPPANGDFRSAATTVGTPPTNPVGSIGFAYDDAGRRVSMTDPTGTTSWGYDAANRVTSIASLDLPRYGGQVDSRRPA